MIAFVMKKLKFLIKYTYNKITDKLVGYLVETGHQVDMVKTSDSEKWLSKYHYNLNIIESQSNMKAYDFILETRRRKTANSPVLHINLKEKAKKTIRCSVKLHNKKDIAEIASRDFNHINRNSDDLYEEIKEVFIDATTFLARNGGESTGRPCTNICECASFLEIIALENAEKKLHLHHKKIASGEHYKFSLKNLIEKNLPYNSRKSTTLKKIVLDDIQVEFLLVFLLSLLNARREAIFSYNLLHKEKCIRKIIRIKPSMNYQKISKILSNKLYKITENNFSRISFNNYEPSEIQLSIGGKNASKKTQGSFLSINYCPAKKELKISYHSALIFFDEVKEYVSYFIKKFNSWRKNEKPLQSILYTEAGLYHKQIYEWNNTFSPKLEGKTVHELFEKQVSRTPDNIAVVYENKKLTYLELNQKANQIANYLLKNHRIIPDDIIALLLKKSEYTIIAILAVLKAGGAYAPIHTEWPEKRINYIIKDTKSSIILTNNSYHEKLKSMLNHKITIIPIDTNLNKKKNSCNSKENPETQAKSSNLSYVIYTSGTTGNPKGVLIEHSGVTNLAIKQGEEFEKYKKRNSAFRNYLLYASYVFDASVSEIFTSILNGHTLHIANSLIRHNLYLLNKYIRNNKIHVATIPPSFLLTKPILKLETLVVAGEKTPSNILNSYRKKTHVINAYGPTEATVCSTLNHYKKNDCNRNIGKPIGNKLIYIMDDNLIPLPAGVTGEIYIGGLGISRGYLNLAKENNKRYVSNPFRTAKEKDNKMSQNLYRTGDLAKQLQNGEIIYLGRNDLQVKLRGFRIEPQEIEEVICNYDGVIQAVVMLKKVGKNQKYLIGYYTSKNKINEGKIRGHLSAHLPTHMIPSELVELDKFPLNINGKIDKKTLLEIEAKGRFIEPKNQIERKICEIFSRCLEKKIIGSTDDFFKLGGNSINVINLTFKLQKYFPATIEDVFKLKTPRNLAEKFSSAEFNLLKNKLQRIKYLYENKQSNIKKTCDKRKVKSYLGETSFSLIESKLNIFLTGATGFLGSNILCYLLEKTNHIVHMLVRGGSQNSAYKRLEEKMKFYFKLDLNSKKDRIVVYNGDLTQSQLGMEDHQYKRMVCCIDSIIHSAALVKHYGEESNFYKNNVKATINLLNLAKLSRKKEFHYISTAASLFEGKYKNYDYYVFDETDDARFIEKNNIYGKTKYAAESLVIKYRKQGIQSNIYRVGNLAFIAKTGQLQENIEDNAFYHWLRALIRIRVVTKEITRVDITPADWAAKAIVTLLNQKNLKNQIFHVFNPHPFDISSVTLNNQKLLRIIPIRKFIDAIVKCIDNGHCQIIQRFLLHQGWLNEPLKNINNVNVLQDRTECILEKCGFKWRPVTNKLFERCILKEQFFKKEI